MNKFKIDEYGTKKWWKNGELHRENGAAIEYPNGDKSWYKDGKRHRKDGPAIEYINGDKFWYKEGKLHRENGPAAEFTNGTKFWYKYGKRHKEDGPAIERVNGGKEWHLNGIFIYNYISKNNILDKIYAETFNKIFINIKKEDTINLADIFNIIDINRVLNE